MELTHQALPGLVCSRASDFSAMVSGSTEAALGGRAALFCRLTVDGVWPGVVDPGRRGIPDMPPLLEDEVMDLPE